jgi:catechol 2,3-dioxygenase-like lactoylglutathione lyase family enzyme
MPKLRHIALATNDPEKTAKFYCDAFGFKEVGRTGDPNKPEKGIAWGIYISDGTLNMAVLKFKNVDQLGKGLDYVGIHHFGVLVEDLDTTMKKLESMGHPCFMKQEAGATASFFETKFRGPDGVVFDVSEHAWVGAAKLDEEEAKPKVAVPAE